MSKHHKKCCADPMMMYGQYGMGGFGGGGCGGGGFGGGTGCGGNYGGWGIRWIYALLILVVIVLQFARRPGRAVVASPCGGNELAVTSTGKDEVAVAATGGFFGGSGLFGGELIDNSVLFIIVVFLLILCTGCWTGGCNNYGSQGYGGGFGY